MFKERSSGVKKPNSGDLKQRCLTLAKKGLYKNELLVIVLRALLEVPSKVFHAIQFI